jgi:hypothetical protein
MEEIFHTLMFEDILKRDSICSDEVYNDCPVKDIECDRCVPYACIKGIMRECIIQTGMLWSDCPAYKEVGGGDMSCKYNTEDRWR